ncbi:spore coat protein [Ramlibacter tataouinensis]|uniref:Spore coat protein n=2 Tax=Ramlibacter tataouinensis TaxID=94132 RepID=A0A127JPZ7_9BURK|nr:spore coat protein [Ramlibacter tataouinensis]
MSSTRLPGKVLLRSCGKPLLQHLIERARRCPQIDQLVVATSTDASDDPLQSLCDGLGVPCHRGSLDDVLDRFMGAARPLAPGWVVRLTGDCPLIDPDVIGRVVSAAREPGVDYASNALVPTFPDGLDVECMRAEVLEQAWREARKPSEREHVTPFIHTQPERFALRQVRQEADLSALRWTVDEPSDFVFVSQVFEHLYPVQPDFRMNDVLELLRREPRLARINTGLARNEGYARSLAAEAGAAA